MIKSLLVAVLCLTFTSISAQGGGLLLYEVGSPGIGNAYAGQSAISEDASTAYLNPAAMGQVEDQTVLIGLQGVLTTIDYLGDNGETADAGGITPMFGFYWIKHLNEKWSIGTTVNIPMGSGFNYGEDWDGRYYVESALLAVTNIAPTVSYNFSEKFSLGAAINLYLGLLEEELALKSINPLNRTDGQAKLSGLNFNVGFQLGLHFRPNDYTALGLTYRYQSKIEFKGNADITNWIGQNGDQVTSLPFSTEMIIPHGLNLSLARQMGSLELLMDVGYTDWSSFVNQPIVLNDDIDAALHRNWKDTYRVGVGVNKKMKNNFTGRLGFSYDSDPIRKNEMSPDMPVGEAFRFAAGFSKKTEKNNSYSIGVTYLLSEGQNIDLSSPLQGDLKGSYDNLGLIAIGLSYGF